MGTKFKLKKSKERHGKKLKLKKRTDKDVGLEQRELFPEENERIAKIAERIRRVCRPYSLSFGGLPKEKKADEATKTKMLGDIKTDKKSIRVVRRLLPKHDLLSQLGKAERAVRDLFEAVTYPYVVRGQRLFIFDDAKIDFENWDQEKIEQELARQRMQFQVDIDNLIHLYYNKRSDVIAKWDDIIAAAKEQLGDLYNAKDYHTARDLEAYLYVDFGPEGVLEAGTESRFMHGDVQNREQQRMRERFEAVVKLQEDVFLQTFKKAVDQALKSIQRTDSGAQEYFQDSVINEMFSKFLEFKNKCLKYGMLRGTAVEEEVSRCIKSLNADEMSVKDVATFIRKSDMRRKSVIEDLSTVAERLGKVMTDRSNRRTIIRRVGGGDEE